MKIEFSSSTLALNSSSMASWPTSTIKDTHYCKANKTPVNVSRAYIAIPSDYICDVRVGTALDQTLHFPSSIPRPNHIRVVKKISKIVLGLEAEPHIRGLPTTGGYYT